MNKTWFPDSVQLGERYSFWGDVKLNAWALVAVVVSVASRWMLQHNPGWGTILQAMVALSPLAPSLLYVRSLARWIGSMDELQRLIQLEACLFATIGTIFLATALGLLESYGVLSSVRLQNGLGWEGTFAMIVVLYIIGNAIINRRYR